MNEFEIIRRYFVRSGADDSVCLGIGDDGAVLSPAAERQLVCVVDTIVEGIHYPAGSSAADAGFRAVAVNLSDLAAMGARPRWMTLALTLSRNDGEWLEAFAAGLFEAAGEWRMPLVGGDTTRGDQTVASVQLLGDVERDAFLTRGGARPGDDLYVTGTPGDAAGGLALMQSAGVAPADGSDAARLRGRFARPAARVAFGQSLARVAGAAIDVSDGLYADASKLLAASGAGGRIEIEALPLSGPLRRVFGDDRARHLALTGGDDYELCFAAAPARAADVQAAADRLGLRVTRIGRVVEGAGLVVLCGGEPAAFADDGYRHF